MDLPRVSVLLPIYNAHATLGECLDSLAAQSFEAFELVAVDDGSTDGTAELLRQRAAADPRIRLLAPGRVGLVAALNAGLAACRAELVARMDADDVAATERLRLQRDYLLQHADVAVVGSRVELLAPSDATGYPEYLRWQNGCLAPEEIAANLYVEAPLAHPSVMFCRAAVEEVGGYRAGDFPEDYDLWLRMHRAGHRLAKLPQVLLAWRDAPTRTSRIDPRYAESAFDALRAEYLASDERVRRAEEIVIWGAGRKTRQRVRLLFERGIRAAAWIDVNPRKIGKRIWDLPVHEPQWLAERNPRPLVLAYVRTHGARELIATALAGWGYAAGRDYLPVG